MPVPAEGKAMKRRSREGEPSNTRRHKTVKHRSATQSVRSLGMHIRRLDHVQLAMPAGREKEARAFYQELLGIPEVVKPRHLAARGGCWFEHGDLKVHLGVEADFSPARKAHPAFIVDDLQNLVRSLRGAGYRVIADQPLEGYDRVYTDDPFGNRIELMQPTGR